MSKIAAEQRARNAELSGFNVLQVDSEVRMLELKGEINPMCMQADTLAEYMVYGELLASRPRT
jgi:hypothetical protein